MHHQRPVSLVLPRASIRSSHSRRRRERPRASPSFVRSIARRVSHLVAGVSRARRGRARDDIRNGGTPRRVVTHHAEFSRSARPLEPMEVVCMITVVSRSSLSRSARPLEPMYVVFIVVVSRSLDAAARRIDGRVVDDARERRRARVRARARANVPRESIVERVRGVRSRRAGRGAGDRGDVRARRSVRRTKERAVCRVSRRRCDGERARRGSSR